MKHQRLLVAVPGMAPANRESYWLDPVRDLGWQLAGRMMGRSVRQDEMTGRTAGNRGGSDK